MEGNCRGRLRTCSRQRVVANEAERPSLLPVTISRVCLPLPLYSWATVGTRRHYGHNRGCRGTFEFPLPRPTSARECPSLSGSVSHGLAHVSRCGRLRPES